MEWEMAFRLFSAGVLGGLIGYEREHHHKAAGLRTHILVSMGSCLIMILSVKMFHLAQGMTNADPARLAAQVVSGIGFLGAGSIMKEGVNIRGLTTAASLWVVAGVGLATGAGYYMGALTTAVLVLLTLSVLAHLEKKEYGTVMHLSVTTKDRPGQIGEIGLILGNHNISISDIQILPHGEVIEIIFLLRTPDGVVMNELTTQIASIQGVSSVRRE
jgi:putative Mg2+ transporter-C (MgtC) family protein